MNNRQVVNHLLNAISYLPVISVAAVAIGTIVLITSFVGVQGSALILLGGIGLALFSLLGVGLLTSRRKKALQLREPLGIEDRVTVSLQRKKELEEKFEGTVARALSGAGFDVARDIEARVRLKSIGIREPVARYGFDLVVFAGDKIIPIEIKTRPIEPSDVLSVSMKAKEWMTVFRNVTIPIIVTTTPVSRITFSESSDKVRLIGNGNVSQLVQYINSMQLWMAWKTFPRWWNDFWGSWSELIRSKVGLFVLV